MPAQPTVITNVPATQDFDFLYGAFQLSKVHIPYFATTLSLQEAASDLKLTSEIFGSEDINWSLTELFQREIDWSRVHKKIVPYLQTSEAPQFFNSITIALLPYDPNKSRLLDAFDESVPWTPPPLTDKDAYPKKITVGPIAFGFWGDWSEPGDDGFRFGRMRWNKNQVVGVAIDGQHRLAAIKEITKDGMPSTSLIKSRVPVLFLLFDPKVGYSNFKNQPTVEILRELFIDLNKHAQTVKRGRQILLDDRDPHAVCTRTIIAERLSNNANSLDDIEPRIPLSLVDWHSDQAKFDKGPYLTTVLGLDAFMMRILATKPISDWMDFRGVETQIRKLENRLKISLQNALARQQHLAKYEIGAFTYNDEDLKTIQKAFGHIWLAPLVNLLSNLEPYAELIAMRREDGSLSIRFQEWFRLYEAKSKEGQFEGNATASYSQFLLRAAADEDSPMAEIDFLDELHKIEDAKTEGTEGVSLAYNVVFQRALVEGFVDYCEISAEDIDELTWEAGDEDIDFAEALDAGESSEIDDDLVEDADQDEESEADTDGEVLGPEGIAQINAEGAVAKAQYNARSDEYVDSINSVIRNTEFLIKDFAIESEEAQSDEFWEGSLLKADGAIDFTLGASSRAKDLFLAIALMTLFSNSIDTEDTFDFDDFWASCLDRDAGAICKKAHKAINALSREGSVGGRILKARDVDYDFDSAREEVFHRLKYIWESVDL